VEHLFKAQALVAMLLIDQTPWRLCLFLDFALILPLTYQLRQSLPLGCVGELARVAKVFIPLAPTSTSFEIVNML
jgi:hypothetical protein